jgi:hypothetical protein
MKHRNLLGSEPLAEKMEKLKKQFHQDNVDKAEVTPIQVEEKAKNPKLSPKLFISGRLDRKTYKYTARSLTLLNDTLEEMNMYCKGSELAILNYLIKEGLNKVKTSSEIINVDIEDIEKGII